MVTYNQNGTSRGIAAITFARPDTAAKAAKELNGLLIDKRPIKVHGISLRPMLLHLTPFYRLRLFLMRLERHLFRPSSLLRNVLCKLQSFSSPIVVID
jgi:hypothetical protein